MVIFCIDFKKKNSHKKHKLSVEFVGSHKQHIGFNGLIFQTLSINQWHSGKISYAIYCPYRATSGGNMGEISLVAVCYLLGNSPVSEFYMARHLGVSYTNLPMKMGQCSETSAYKSKASRRKHTTYRTRRKFEIKNSFVVFPARIFTMKNALRADVLYRIPTESGVAIYCPE
jgi:hypothetical protein